MQRALKLTTIIERIEGAQPDPHADYITRIDSPMFRSADDPGIERADAPLWKRMR